MAKTVTKTVEVLEGEEAETEKPEAIEEDVLRALTEMEGADEVKWQVHRISQPNPGFCPPELSTAELSMQRISSDFGPGRYRIKGIKSNGHYYKSATVTIAQPTKPTDNTANILDALKERGGSLDMQLIFQMFQQQSQNQTALLTAMIAKPQTEIPWGAIAAASPGILSAVKEFFVRRDNEDASMEKILKLVTIVEKLKGDGNGKETSWADLVKDALPSLATAFNRQPAPQVQQPVSARTMAPSVQPAQIPETPEAVEPTSEILAMNWLRDKLNELITCAQNNKNPELRAEVFCDDLPVYIPESMVVSLLSGDDWFEKLTAFDNRVLNYPAWFAELRTCILETLQPDGADDDNRTPATDPGRNPSARGSSE